ncbi:SGNH/GDSL hydrolase family protein [Spirosoma rigui]|uniref:SGNH/GDSL hydrolase family protein n=1 Tax=Spirosoma rigui TaxID=564064 RepID=UPI0009B14385|nr:GDSL-type esterase/lipase family protein [Spirosoma rigui]
MTTFYRFLSLAFIAGLLAMSAAKPTRVVFFGDSITQAGVNPGGYIDKLKKMVPADQYELIGAGIGGNKIYDLFLRMDEDVLAKQPDVVVIWVGVNDVWHKATSGTGTDPDKFVKFYEAVIKKLQAANVRVILCTPAAIGEKTDMTNQQDGDLNQYSQFIRDLAKKQNLPLVDLRKAFQEYDLKNNPENKDRGILTTDRVHLNETGNQFVADQMKAVLAAAK